MNFSRALVQTWLVFVLLCAFSLQGCVVHSRRFLVEGATPPSVLFRLKQLPRGRSLGAHRFACVYTMGGKTARFQLILDAGHLLSAGGAIVSTTGSFASVSGANNSALLQRLKVALDAKHMPRRVVRVAELQFSALTMAENQSRGTSGDYVDKPQGHWTLIKLFFPRGGDRGEMYLGLNAVDGLGELSLKDSDYGDYLLAQLAKVL